MSIKLVSAYISHTNSYRSIDKYIELGKVLLKINLHKIIFLDELAYELLKDYENDFTKIIKINKNDFYLFNLQDEITNFELYTNNKDKDTLEYILTQCSKTEWIRKAIENDGFNELNNYIWIDFGIRHIFQDDDIFSNAVLNLKTKFYDKVRIASIWNLDYKYNINLLKNISWYFAGGVFGGDSKYLIIFADKMKNICLHLIKTEKSLPWEVNLWYLIYLENKELFSCYNSDHNNTLIDNY
jgi:hypothetical protein